MMGTPSSATLVLRARRSEIVDELVERLHASTAPHYSHPEPALVRVRCERLVGAFLESVEGEPSRLSRYLRAIAGERFDEGVALTELQLVLHLLESRCWELCTEGIEERDELVTSLGRVSGVIGHGKDTLAQVYLEHAKASRQDLRSLRRQLEILSQGTDTAMLAE